VGQAKAGVQSNGEARVYVLWKEAEAILAQNTSQEYSMMAAQGQGHLLHIKPQLDSCPGFILKSCHHTLI
jgi:hypothetical protein